MGGTTGLEPFRRKEGMPLPDNPSLDWLRKQAKRHLDELRKANSDAQLADAQFEIAKRYGFSSWRGLKAHVDSLSIEGQLFEAARSGNQPRLVELLDEHPDPSEEQIKHYLTGNLCRCATYPEVMDAVRLAAKKRNAAPAG